MIATGGGERRGGTDQVNHRENKSGNYQEARFPRIPSEEAAQKREVRGEREEGVGGFSSPQELLREGPPLGALPAAYAQNRAGPVVNIRFRRPTLPGRPSPGSGPSV